MQIRTQTRAGLLTVGLLAAVTLTAGCGGGSSTQVRPLDTPTTVGAAGGARTSTAPGRTGATTVVPGSVPGDVPASATTPPNAAQLSVIKQDLQQAGSALDGSDGAISGTDVNQAKTQEGSAP